MPPVVGELTFDVVDPAELPEHAGEVGLTVHEVAAERPEGGPQAEVLAVDDRLGAYQLPVEDVERKLGGNDGVLDVEDR